MADDLKEIRKLRPGERIARLKELEEDRKKEIQEAERLIEDSIAEIREERIREEIEVPRAGEADISHHFIPKDQSLESVAQREKPAEVLEEAVSQYASRLEEIREGFYENPERAYELMQEAREQMVRLNEIGEHYSLTKSAARAFSMAVNIYEDLKKYRT